MSEHDEQAEEHELYEEVPPRSIFAATWFRVLLVVIVIGVIGAVAIPYVLDFMNPPPSKPATAKAPAPAADTSKDTPLIPAPVPAPVESKPSVPTARPAEPPAAASKAPEPPKTAATSPAEKAKSAMAVTESKPAASAAKPDTAKPAPAAKPDATAKTDTAAKADMAKPAASAKTDTVAKADTTKPAGKDTTTKPAVAARPAAEPKRAAATATASRPATGSGPFWVQVGAFRDADTAKRLADKLRADNFKVEESATRTGGAAPVKSAPKPAPAAAPSAPDIGADHYDVFVTGQTPDELNKRLSAKGLAAEPSGAGMVVKPSLPLRDAVALSKDLAVEGFKVQVRRSGGSMGSASPAPAPSAPATAAAGEGGGGELHRVRVGAFPDRAAAQEAVKQLEAKGYKPYIARGDQ